jgi:hypothetical protein
MAAIFDSLISLPALLFFFVLGFYMSVTSAYKTAYGSLQSERNVQQIAINFALAFAGVIVSNIAIYLLLATRKTL